MPPTEQKRRYIVKGVWLVSILLFASLALIDYVPAFSSRGRSRVVLLDNGLLDFDRPQDHPPDSGTEGMFGSLIDYLRMMGFSTERTKGPFTSELLSKTDILIVINPFYQWSDDELALIKKWVNDGGALLALGDHTDLGGMNQSLNPLLTQFGARFNFETGDAHKAILRHGWRVGYHPAFFGVSYYSHLYWGTGGTLSVSLPFEPVVEGAYAFGDVGNYQANSYFGNRSYDRGEKAGDITLAAVAGPGRGKVAVFADTSPFLNGTIHLSFHPFVYNLFRWLESRSHVSNPYAVRWICSAMLVGLVIWGWRTWEVSMLRAAMVIVIAVLLFDRYTSVQELEPARGEKPIAILDFSHLPKWATDPFQNHSVDGTAGVLLRTGYLPITMWKFDRALLSHANLVMINEPASRYGDAERRALYDWVRAGGILVVGGSFETPDATNDLIAPLGLQLNKVPLGTAYPEVAYSGSKEYVDIPNTAPIAYREVPQALQVQYSTRVLAENEGYPVAVRVEMGKGRVVLIGSDRFLTSESLQDRDNPRRGVNVTWLLTTLKETAAEVAN